MQPQQDSGVIASLLPLVVLFAIFYFLVIRPQQKQQKNHKNMLDSLTRGDKIITNGGLIGKIEKVEDDFFKVELGDKVVVRLSKEFVNKKIELESEIKNS